MLILEIALGIVLGFIIINFLGVILEIGIGLGVIVLVLAVLGVLLYIGYEFMMPILTTIVCIFAALFLLSISGILAEKVFNIKKFGGKNTLEFLPYNKSESIYEYLADRVTLGVAHVFFIILLFTMADKFFGLDSNAKLAYALSMLLIIYAIVLFFRYKKIYLK
jgi:hypothetical protein